MRADDKLGARVPLVVGDVVVRLEPDPLLTFGQEAVVTGLPFSVLHHWTEKTRQRCEEHLQGAYKGEEAWNTTTYSARDTLPASPGRPHGNSHTLMFPAPRKVSSL